MSATAHYDTVLLLRYSQAGQSGRSAAEAISTIAAIGAAITVVGGMFRGFPSVNICGKAVSFVFDAEVVGVDTDGLDRCCSFGVRWRVPDMLNCSFSIPRNVSLELLQTQFSS